MARRSRLGGGRTRRLRKYGSWLAVIAVWFAFLSPASLGGPVSLIWVSGSSMEPTFVTGDLAVLYERSAYTAGEVVAFEIPEGGTVIHRVIESTEDGYRFRGDNRQMDDPWVLTENEILGREVFSIPGAARMLAALTHPLVLGVLVACLVLLLAHRPKPDATPSLGPGYLDWGVVPGSNVWLRPSVRGYRRRQRAQRLMEAYRRELIAFQQWPSQERSPIS